MRRVLVVLMLLAGCKGMGALGHGLGHLGHAMGSVGKVASASGHVLAPLARAAVRIAPAVINTAVAASEVQVEVVPEGPPVERAPVGGGPLIDDGDACGYCPEDLDCGQCGDVNHVACVLTPPGAYARCESQLKLRPPGA